MVIKLSITLAIKIILLVIIYKVCLKELPTTTRSMSGCQDFTI